MLSLMTPMKREDLLARISIRPDVCFGKPCIRGHRIWVSLILDFLASGMTVHEILDENPGLEEADVFACIAYGAEVSARDTSRFRSSLGSEAEVIERGRIRAYQEEAADD